MFVSRIVFRVTHSRTDFGFRKSQPSRTQRHKVEELFPILRTCSSISIWLYAMHQLGDSRFAEERLHDMAGPKDRDSLMASQSHPRVLLTTVTPATGISREPNRNSVPAGRCNVAGSGL
jgi:hypothetical protein